jgi:hypothetical protein
MKKYFVALVIFSVVGAIYYLNSSEKSQQGNQTSESSAVNPTEILPSATPIASTKASPQIGPQPAMSHSPSAEEQEDFTKKTATELAPDQQTLRHEAEKDPERVPPSTLFFAVRLGKKMETALKSEEGAASLFQELQDCVTSQRLEGSVTSQTLCLQDAQQLSQAYPNRLKEQYATLFERAEPRVRSLLVPIHH